MTAALAQWVSTKRYIPYRFRKSVIKRFYPQMLEDYPFEIDFFGMKYSGNAREYIDRMVYFCGAHEKYMLFFLRDVIQIMRLKDIVFLDIGANVGNHSLFMAPLVERVHAFEPYEAVRKELERKIKDNKIGNVKVHPVGLSNENKTLPFYAPPSSNRGAGSFTEGHYQGNRYIGELPLVVGDEEVARLKLRHVDFIKMDVEGHERFALEGLKETLWKYRPIVLLELSDSTRNTFKDFEDFRSAFPEGYALLRFTRASKDYGSYKVAFLDYETPYKNKDVIACPQEKLKYIQNLEAR